LNEIAYRLISTYPNQLQASEAYLLLAHGRDDSDKEIFTLIESSRDLTANLTLRNLNIILRGTVLSHQVKEPIINVDLKNTRVQPRSITILNFTFKKDTHELVFRTLDVGDVHVVGGGADIFL
jgi:hypothetical protein